MLIDSADRGRKAETEEGFDAGAKLRSRLLGCAGDIGLQSLAPRLYGCAALRIQGSEGGSETLFGFGEDKINMNFDAAAKFLDAVAGSLLQERASFAGAGLKFQGDFLGHHLLMFRQTDELPIGYTSGEIFKFFGSAVHGLLEGGEILRSNFGRTRNGRSSRGLSKRGLSKFRAPSRGGRELRPA